MRALRLLFALLAIPVALWAGRTICWAREAAWIAAVLTAFNPFLSQYAQEARMYALVALLAISRARLLRARLRARHRRAPAAVGSRFAVSLAALLYTHNWPIFFATALRGRVAVPAVRARAASAGASCSRDGLLGFGGALVLYLPWVPTTLYQAAHTGAPWSDAPTVVALLGVARADARPYAADRR